jgi:phage-related protein
MTTDYIRLEDSYEPDVYRLAVYEESNTLDNILATAGKCEITFSCKPQKYLLSGEKQIQISQSNQIIHNPTEQSSYPIIKFKGTGSIFVNGVELAVYANRNEVTIDCETVNTVDATGNNMNYYTYTEKLITLRPGDNVITFSDSVYDVKVIPRWWTI